LTAIDETFTVGRRTDDMLINCGSIA